MTIVNRNVVNSSIYERIGSIQMSQGERALAVAAMEDGEKIAELILNVAHVLRLFFTTPGLKPSFKN